MINIINEQSKKYKELAIKIEKTMIMANVYLLATKTELLVFDSANTNDLFKAFRALVKVGDLIKDFYYKYNRRKDTPLRLTRPKQKIKYDDNDKHHYRF